jgi:ribonuclease I
MKEKLPYTGSARTEPPMPSAELTNLQWRSAVPRRSFFRGLGIIGATLLPASTVLVNKVKGQGTSSSGKLSKGDADLLRFAAWAEIVESDLWTQYNELGATAPNDGPANVGNPAYKLALKISTATCRSTSQIIMMMN